jgi:hypothetical protein
MDYPSQISRTLPPQSWPADPKFDCRDYLHPRRVNRHHVGSGISVRAPLPGESIADYNQLLMKPLNGAPTQCASIHAQSDPSRPPRKHNCVGRPQRPIKALGQHQEWQRSRQFVVD